MKKIVCIIILFPLPLFCLQIARPARLIVARERMPVRIHSPLTVRPLLLTRTMHDNALDDEEPEMPKLGSKEKPVATHNPAVTAPTDNHDNAKHEESEQPKPERSPLAQYALGICGGTAGTCIGGSAAGVASIPVSCVASAVLAVDIYPFAYAGPWAAAGAAAGGIAGAHLAGNKKGVAAFIIGGAALATAAKVMEEL